MFGKKKRFSFLTIYRWLFLCATSVSDSAHGTCLSTISSYSNTQKRKQKFQNVYSDVWFKSSNNVTPKHCFMLPWAIYLYWGTEHVLESVLQDNRTWRSAKHPAWAIKSVSLDVTNLCHLILLINISCIIIALSDIYLSKYTIFRHFSFLNVILVWYTGTRVSWVVLPLEVKSRRSSHIVLWFLQGKIKASEKTPRSIVSYALWFDERFYLCSLMCIAL